eukprot:UN25527
MIDKDTSNQCPSPTGQQRATQNENTFVEIQEQCGNYIKKTNQQQQLEDIESSSLCVQDLEDVPMQFDNHNEEKPVENYQFLDDIGDILSKDGGVQTPEIKENRKPMMDDTYALLNNDINTTVQESFSKTIS